MTRTVLSDGTDDVQWDFRAAGQRIGSLMTRNEAFAIDDYSTAKARYDELTAQHRPGGGQTPSGNHHGAATRHVPEGV